MPLGVVDARQVHHGLRLRRGHRLVLLIDGDARQPPDNLVRLFLDRGVQLRVGPLAQYDHLPRMTRAGEDRLHPIGHRDRRDQHRNGQADAQGRHEGRPFALDKVAEVVGDWNAHSHSEEAAFVISP
jgi:hypothetical protein